MPKPLLLDVQTVNDYLEKNDFITLATYLKNTFKLERSEGGAPMKYEFSKDAIDTLLQVLKVIINTTLSDDTKDLSRELCRSLRNYVVNSEVQSYLLNNDTFLNNVKILMTTLHNSLILDILQILLQFLINLIISSAVAACKVFNIFSNEIITFLKEKIVIYETTALLYNISLHKSLDSLGFDLYLCLLELYEISKDIEFLQFLLETFISYDNFWSSHKSLNLTHRLMILQIIRCKQIEGKDLNLPHCGIATLVDQFVKSGDTIFQTVVTNESNLEPYEVSQLLEVISSLCSNEYYLKILQNDKNLLINSGVLLINIHRLGKESENYFSTVQKLSEIREPNSNICEHPAFGFKAGLIRIIGNLCWKNNTMQDLVREAELIPVLLDCCNMDARNPFIMQWVILAIRNLCENNFKNQEVIAGMHQQGGVSSATLEEMGLTLHSDGNNSVKIVPLETLQNLK